ncbi:hypothetical protein [Porphyromonas uenonis]|uniref:hypothetical protein n=1 Tax=Porphyromonas uenonis TaxID=281920 RepID=UPI000AB757F6|nr:hypothetical protein [Porphyromonas uenonis]
MKRITSILLLLIAGLFTFTSCDDDNPITGGDTPQGPERISQWMLPIERYGIAIDEVAQIEEGRGNKVERSEELMTLTATPQDTKQYERSSTTLTGLVSIRSLAYSLLRRRPLSSSSTSICSTTASSRATSAPLRLRRRSTPAHHAVAAFPQLSS